MNTQKGFASILLILLGLIVLGGGTYYLKVNNDKTNLVQDNSENSDNGSSVKVADEDKDDEPQIKQRTPQEVIRPALIENKPNIKLTDKKDPDIVAVPKVDMGAEIHVSKTLSNFVDSLIACTNTKYNRSMTADLFGNNAATDVSYEISTKEGKCTLGITLNKIELSLGDELSKYIEQPNAQFLNPEGGELGIEEFYKNLNKTYSALIGKSGYCEVAGNKESLLEFFTKEKGDLMSYSDVALILFGEDLNCKGDLFIESQKINSQ